MIRQKKSNIVFFIFMQAMAVSIICFGSLINFHQYKIWGKPLIPNFVCSKREVEKYCQTLSLSDLKRDNQQLQQDYHGSDLDFPVHIPGIIPGSPVFITIDPGQAITVLYRVTPSGLRGPPVS